MKKEWILVSLTALSAVILANIPVFWGYLNQPEGFVFSSVGRDDEYVYLSWIGQAKQGQWVFDNPYTTERHRRLYLNPLFLFLGKIASAFSLSPFLVFNLSRLVFGFLTLLVIYQFLSYFIKDLDLRFFTFLVICFSGGFGFLEIFNRKSDWLFYNLWVSRKTNEGLTFTSLLFYPQSTVSVALMLSYFLVQFRILKEPKVWLFVLGMCLGNLLILIHPYDIVILVLVPLVFLLLQQSEKRRWLYFFILNLTLFPSTLYTFLISQLDPVYKAWTHVPQISPPLFHFFLLYGFLAILAGLQVFSYLGQRKRGRLAFLAGWFLLLPFLVKLPVFFQRRLIEGAHIPISILASFFLFKILKKFKRSYLFFLLSIVFLSLHNIYWLNCKIDLLKNDPRGYYFLSREKILALSWLDKQFTNRNVLAIPDDGLIIPAFTDNKVYWGHWANTPDSIKKGEVLTSFLDKNTSDFRRVDFLKKEEVDYFFFKKDKTSPVKAEIFDPIKKTYLKSIFENKEVIIFEVRV
ncbi:hypothetical protein ES702_02727 [subsurface metagenome]